ncbi:MAG: cellulose synthase [Streptosporangiales bacterium]
MDYAEAFWLPAAIALSALGVLISIWRWRRRGVGSGLRGLAWSILPIAAYLIGILHLLVPFAVRVVDWALGLVFSLGSWIGFALIALSVVLWIVSGVIIGRRQAAVQEAKESGAVESGEKSDRKAVTGNRQTEANTQESDDDFGDIEAILKKRGIQ